MPGNDTNQHFQLAQDFAKNAITTSYTINAGGLVALPILVQMFDVDLSDHKIQGAILGAAIFFGAGLFLNGLVSTCAYLANEAAGRQKNTDKKIKIYGMEVNNRKYRQLGDSFLTWKRRAMILFLISLITFIIGAYNVAKIPPP